MFKLLVLSLSLFSFTASISQGKTNQKAPTRKELKYDGLKKILQLKEGMLIFRLQTKKQSIEALKQRGEFEKAQELKTKVEKHNRAILKQLEKHFNFCDYYIVYSDQSSQVKEDYTKAVFIDNNFVPTDAPDAGRFFLTADNSKANTHPKINELSPLGFILRDQEFHQIKRPI